MRTSVAGPGSRPPRCTSESASSNAPVRSAVPGDRRPRCAGLFVTALIAVTPFDPTQPDDLRTRPGLRRSRGLPERRRRGQLHPQGACADHLGPRGPDPTAPREGRGQHDHRGALGAVRGPVAPTIDRSADLGLQGSERGQTLVGGPVALPPLPDGPARIELRQGPPRPEAAAAQAARGGTRSSRTGSSGLAAAEIATQTRFVISSSLPSTEPSRAEPPSRATHSGSPSGRAGSVRGESSGAVARRARSRASAVVRRSRPLDRPTDRVLQCGQGRPVQRQRSRPASAEDARTRHAGSGPGPARAPGRTVRPPRARSLAPPRARRTDPSASRKPRGFEQGGSAE